MKILQVNILGATLSTGRTTREMHNYFQSHGIESYIACPTNKDCDDAFTFTTPNRIKIDYLLTMVTGKEAYHSRGPTKKLIEYIKKLTPDVVHLRVLHGNCIHLGMLLSYLGKSDIPTVITMHDFWMMTGMCFHYTNRGCYRWKNGCGKCPAMKNDVRQKKFDRTHMMWKSKKKHFHAIPRLAVIGVSDWVVNQVKESYLGDASIVRKIYNWIDLDVFYPRESSSLRATLKLEGKFVVLGVSASWRVGDSKGLDTYIRLAEVMPENYCIVLIGEMIYDGQLPDNIIVVPRTYCTDELAQYYSMADVYLNLSSEETFGKVSAEAVSCGTPLVAYDATANRELVPEGAGEIIESLQTEEIIEALRRIEKKNKSVYLPMCRQFAEENYNKDTNIGMYISVYEELINKAAKIEHS